MFKKIERQKTLDRKDKIFIDYINDQKEIKKYFKDKIDFEDNKAISRELINTLKKYNQDCGAERKTLENIEKLKEKDTCVVITGQQPVLVAGSIYIIYKIIDTIKYAKDLSKKLKREVIPVFWNASDDDDWEEVNQVCLINKENLLKIIKIRAKKDIKNIPFGKISLDNLCITEFIEELKDSLADTKFKEEVIFTITDSREKATYYSQWFSALILRLFSKYGLIIIDPNEKKVKELLKPLLKKEIENPTCSTRLLDKTGKQLKIDGYTPKIHKLSHLCNFYILRDDRRCKVSYHHNYFLVGEERFNQKELLKYLEDRPESFYVNVVLRTLAQSLLLPVVGCVCGPGEVAYSAQLKDIYKTFNIRMPYIIPRNSATLIEERIYKILNKYNLHPFELKSEQDVLVKKIVKKRHRLEEIGRLKNKTIGSLEGIKKHILDIDQNLLSVFKKLNYQIKLSFDDFEKSVIKHKKKDAEIIYKQINRLKDNLFPKNCLQERCLNIYYFLNKYGLDFVDCLLERIPFDFRYHYYVKID
ncbi:MAG: bacillithiol biosynthesis cysteine-adding enzyme BshC [bacterium]|nr:bacillithiol biosynthesis cysteine-adding enzyme BshC [bacterium]